MYNPYMNDHERMSYPRVGDIILYTVNQGDNVYRLAKIFNSQIDWIKCMNGLNDDFMIQPHQQLLIPIMFEKPAMPPYQRQSYTFKIFIE